LSSSFVLYPEMLLLCAGRVCDDAYRSSREPSILGNGPLGERWARERDEVLSEYSENKLVWMELSGGALGVFTLGSAVRMRPRCP